jgi:hypothetical protein
MEKYKKNIHSQNGEDGIIEHLLSKIPTNGWCCEFGVWDGKYLSNTFNLVENSDYNSVYIESDVNKFNDLLITKSQYPKIIAKNRLIDLKDNTLDKILSETNIPVDFDVLSIDIDGLDYAIWESLTKYTPKIVVIEINSSLDPSVILQGDELSAENQIKYGVNFMTCYNLGVAKGYTFMYHTGNMIFINSKYNELFDSIPDNQNITSYFDKKWIN